jgi:uncharacterized membrane protein HdeD (DUF308 family)
MRMRALVQNWWMMAIRGVLAIGFGVAVLMWPDVTLSTMVVLFGAYAVLDGGWAIAAAVRAIEVVRDAWPVLCEGVASLALGALALVWPTVPMTFVYLLAAWGVATGIFELIAAIDTPRARPAHWLLATGGASSLFLAVLVLLLPFADTDIIARVIAAYAQIFGVALLLAALDFPRRRAMDAGTAPWM